jgi:hypothetical protein
MALTNRGLFMLCGVIMLTGISCSFPFPERTTSIIPPTNEEELCTQDNRYYYSSYFRFCFEMANEKWQKRVITSLPRSEIGTSITAIDFFIPDDNDDLSLMFTLYVNRLSQINKEVFNEFGINTVYQDKGTLIGVIKNQNILNKEDLVSDYHLIDSMMAKIRVF